MDPKLFSNPISLANGPLQFILLVTFASVATNSPRIAERILASVFVAGVTLLATTRETSVITEPVDSL